MDVAAEKNLLDKQPKQLWEEQCKSKSEEMHRLKRVNMWKKQSAKKEATEKSVKLFFTSKKMLTYVSPTEASHSSLDVFERPAL